MKLEVGMYVRTKYGISKIDEDRRIEYGLMRPVVDILKKEVIIKASHNIIDLIEEEDLIKIEYYSERYEKRVTRLFEVSKYNQYLTFSNAKCEFFLSCGEFTKEDKELRPIIKSIVTKEQFESMSYKVEE